MNGFTFININEHPTNPKKKVFYFREAAQANYFEGMLTESKIEYEKQIDETGDGRIYFGVKRSDFKKVQQLNYLTIGHFRKPFVSDHFFRWLLIIVSGIVLALAFIGAWLSNS
jgi:hypothetical protein